MAKAKAKPKKKRAPKRGVTLEDVLEEIKKIYQRLDKMEDDILVLQGVVRPQTTPLEKKR
jgi:hypothetical protein